MNSIALRGLLSSVVILVAGAGLIVGVLASYALLPPPLTTGWAGEFPYGRAYRLTGGTLTSLCFIAALVLVPAYVLQIASIQGLRPQAGNGVRRFGLASAAAFALLSGLTYAVQLTVVRLAILNGEDYDPLGWLVFQNPGSPMLAADFLGWFLLGAAFLSVVPSFKTGRLETAIRWALVSSAAVGNALVLILAREDPGTGLLFLGATTALLVSADIPLIVFFKRLLNAPAAQRTPT